MILKRPPVVAFAAAICFVTMLLTAPAALAAGKCDTGHQSTVAAPSNLKAVAVSDTQASLKWSAPKNARGVRGYNIYRGGMLVGTSSATSFTDTGLAPNTYYTWTVKAVDAWKRLSPESNSSTVATPIIIRDAVEWAPDTAPASVNGGLIVESTGFLQIDAGVKVMLKPRQSVDVSGTIYAAGSADAPIVFTSSRDKAYGGRGVRRGSDYWGKITVEQGGTFTGDNVKIFYGNTLMDVKGMLTLTNSETAYAGTLGILVEATGEFDGINVKLHDCCTAGQCKGIDAAGVVNLSSSEVSNCPGTGVLVEASGTFNGTYDSIHNCDRGVEVRGSVNFVLCTVSSCNYGLYFNTAIANGVILNSFVGDNSYGIYNARPDDVTVDASMNWWGTPDGPSVYDPATKTWSQAGDRVSSGVNYDNWLTEPAQ